MGKQIVAVWLLIGFSAGVLAESNINRVHISAPITFVYEYITQPDKWHHWIAQSKSAKTSGGSLAAGEKFSEVVSLNGVDTEFQHTVIEARLPVRWAVEFKSTAVVGRIHYQFQETIDGTLFTRTLEYYPRPANPDQHQHLKQLESQIQLSSLQALRKLKHNLEKDWTGLPVNGAKKTTATNQER